MDALKTKRPKTYRKLLKQIRDGKAGNSEQFELMVAGLVRGIVLRETWLPVPEQIGVQAVEVPSRCGSRNCRARIPGPDQEEKLNLQEAASKWREVPRDAQDDRPQR